MSGTQVTREKLPNGLTVLVAEKHDSPVVAINLWVRAGYFDEDDTQIGISHVIEHMFFKGTIDRPRPDQIATEIKSLGGTLNAGARYPFIGRPSRSSSQFMDRTRSCRKASSPIREMSSWPQPWLATS